MGSNPATPTVSRRDRLVPATFVIPCRTASRRAAGGTGRRCCKGAGAAGCRAERAARAHGGRCCRGLGREGGAGRTASGVPGRGDARPRGARRADLATAEVTAQGPLHPLRGAAPVMSHCTRYEPLHPIRRGALPTDRVQRPQSQEQTQNLRDDRRHAEGELKAKTCWFCSDFSACWCGKIHIEVGCFIVGV